MAKTRLKKNVYTGVTSEQMEASFAELAKADARLQKISATMDVEMTRIREKYQDEVLKLTEVRDNATEVVQAYAMENKDTLFVKRKSVETVHGVFGFRTGTPKLKTRKGFTWSSVCNLLKEFAPSYVRVQEDAAKDKLLADREDPEVISLYDKVGVYVDQDETFYVEPKKEEA